MLVYTKKAETDGVGTAGIEVNPKGLAVAYLRAHGYCEAAPKPKPKRAAQTGAVGKPTADGAMRRGRRVRT